MFQEVIRAYEAEQCPLLYVDESGFAQEIPRPYGYAPRGERCHACHDGQAKDRTNIIGALLGTTLITVGLFQGTMTAITVRVWVEPSLVHDLPTASVVVMDNASFHQQTDIRLI